MSAKGTDISRKRLAKSSCPTKRMTALREIGSTKMAPDELKELGEDIKKKPSNSNPALPPLARPTGST
jgi:hypothetical protein